MLVYSYLYTCLLVLKYYCTSYTCIECNVVLINCILFSNFIFVSHLIIISNNVSQPSLIIIITIIIRKLHIQLQQTRMQIAECMLINDYHNTISAIDVHACHFIINIILLYEAYNMDIKSYNLHDQKRSAESDASP